MIAPLKFPTPTLGDDSFAFEGGDVQPIFAPIDTIDEPINTPLIPPTPIEISPIALQPPVETINVPVDTPIAAPGGVSPSMATIYPAPIGVALPNGAIGVNANGVPVDATGKVILGAAQLGVQIAQVAGAPTVYPAPAGATLPAGAIGVNAQGQPINSAGQILSTTPLGSSFGAWFSQSTLISGIPNYAVLGGGLILLAALSSFSAGRYKVSKRR